jgi:hypothetical protein
MGYGLSKEEKALANEWWSENTSTFRAHGWIADDNEGNALSLSDVMIRFAKWYKNKI